MSNLKIFKFLSFIMAVLYLTTGCANTLRTEKADNRIDKESLTMAEIPKEEMMARWQDFSTPGESHKVLNNLVGNWNHTVEFWMDPNAPSEKSKGKSNIQWTMGNRYIEQTAKGTSMGQPFQGRGIIGYDKAANVYRTVWYDNMGTGMMIGTGSYDSANKKLTETGTSSCPIYGTVLYRGVTTLIDPNRYTYEMFITAPDQKESRVMKVEYSKIKGK